MKREEEKKKHFNESQSMSNLRYTKKFVRG